MNNTKEMFRKWFFIISTPIVLIAFISVEFLFAEIKKETNRLNETYVEQTSYIVDSNLMSAMDLISILKNDEAVKAFVKDYRTDEKERILTINEIKNRMLELCSGNITNCGVYSNKDNMLIDTIYAYTGEEYYEEYFKDSGYDSLWWNNTLNNPGSAASFLLSNTEGTAGGKSIVVCLPLDVANRKTGGTAVIMLDHDMISEAIGYKSDKSVKGFAVYNKNNENILRTDTFNITPKWEKLTGGRGKYTDKGVDVLCMESDKYGLLYVYTFDNIGFINIDDAGWIFLVLLILSVLVSAVFSKYSLSEIRESLNGLFEENKAFKVKEKKHIEGARNTVLSNMLYNIKPPSEMIEEVILEHGLGFGGKCFSVMVVNVVGDDEEFADETAYKSINIAVNRLENVIASTATDFRRLDVQKEYVYILNNDGREALDALCGIIAGDEGAFYGFHIGVGCVVEKLTDVWKAYDEAAVALRYAMLFSRREPVLYDDIKENENNKIFYTKEKENILIRCIKNSDEESVRKIFDELYEQNFNQRLLKYSLKKRLITSLVTAVYTLVEDVFFDNDEEHDKYNRICDNVLKNEDLNEAFEMLKEVGIYLCKSFSLFKGDEKLKKSIEKYIEENYSDKLLSLEKLAETMDMNYSYISRRFKHITGESFTAYVMNVRLQKAAVLITDKKYSVKEVSEMVGFLDSNYFIRSFKKAYGVTPGKYKGEVE